MTPEELKRLGDFWAIRLEEWFDNQARVYDAAAPRIAWTAQDQAQFNRAYNGWLKAGKPGWEA